MKNGVIHAKSVGNSRRWCSTLECINCSVWKCAVPAVHATASPCSAGLLSCWNGIELKRIGLWARRFLMSAPRLSRKQQLSRRIYSWTQRVCNKNGPWGKIGHKKPQPQLWLKSIKFLLFVLVILVKEGSHFSIRCWVREYAWTPYSVCLAHQNSNHQTSKKTIKCFKLTERRFPRKCLQNSHLSYNFADASGVWKRCRT